MFALARAQYAYRARTPFRARWFSTHQASQSSRYEGPPNKRQWLPSLRQHIEVDEPSLSAQEVQRRLDRGQEHPAAILRSLDGEQDVAADAVVLLLNRLHQRLARMNRQQRREAILEEPIAKHVLHILWKNDHLWRTFARDAQTPQWTVSLYAIVEGYDHYIIEWLKCEAPHSRQHDEMSDRWRGILLRNLVQAHFSNASRDCADCAIDTFFEVNVAAQEAKNKWRERKLENSSVPPPPLLYLSLVPAATLVDKELWSAKFGSTSSQAFDRFVSLRRVLLAQSRGVFDRDLASARLALVHPSRPSPDEAIDLIMKHSDGTHGPTNGGLVPPSDNERARNAMRIFFFRTATRAKHAGRHAEAEKIESIYADLYGTPLTFQVWNQGLCLGGPDPVKSQRARNGVYRPK